MKAIDQIMGLCIKITWCKNYDTLFGQCENAYRINFLYGDSTPSDYENSQKSSRRYT